MGRETTECAGKRLDLAQGAAGVRIGDVQGAIGIACLAVGCRDRNPSHIGQAQMVAEHLLVVERFGEEHLRVDHQDRHMRVDLGGHVQQHRRFGAEGRHQRDPAGIEPQRGVKDVFRRCALVSGIQRLDREVGREGYGGLKPHALLPLSHKALP